jgi:hypothetical protein
MGKAATRRECFKLVTVALLAGLFGASLATVTAVQAAKTLPFTTVVRTATAEVDNGQIGFTTSNCRPGEKVVGGGWYLGGGIPTHSRPEVTPTSQGWGAGVRNTLGFDSILYVHAVCAVP